MGSKEPKMSDKVKAYLVTVAFIIVLGLLLFIPAGSLRFWQAWIFWTGSSVLIFFITAYFTRKSPDLFARRVQFKEKEAAAKPPAWLSLYYLGYIVPGLDFRFQWSAVPFELVIAANIIVFLGYVIIIRVFIENRYASTIVQVEQKQQVISTGPYALVRHPMYTGMSMAILFAPLALGSYWAIIPMLLYIPAQVIRIKGEEALLRRDLPGYEEYYHKVRYRLVPGVW